MTLRAKCSFCGAEELLTGVSIPAGGWTQVTVAHPGGNRHLCACPNETPAAIAGAVKDALAKAKK
jgi:hypothetical protein